MRLIIIPLLTLSIYAQASENDKNSANIVSQVMKNAYYSGFCQALESLEAFDRTQDDLVSNNFLADFLTEGAIRSEIPDGKLVSACKAARQKHKAFSDFFLSKGGKLEMQFIDFMERSYRAGYCKIALSLNKFAKRSDNENQVQYAEAFSDTKLGEVLNEKDKKSYKTVCAAYILKYAKDQSELGV